METKRTIGRRALTLTILLSIFTPIGFGLVLSFVTQRMPEPPLEALVRLSPKWVQKGEDLSTRRLVPSIIIRNPTGSAWKNLSIGINKQFYAQEPGGIPADSEVSIPLETFVSRNGSVPFPVGNRDITQVTVFAQLPEGARGVSEYTIPKGVAKPAGDVVEWIAPDPKSKR